jgi:hypothetical protein
MKMFSFSSSRLRRSSLLACGVWLAALHALPSAAQLPAPAPPKPSALNNGSPEEASKYYKELSGKLGLLTPATIEAQANFKVLLDYLGYPELTPEDAEFATPESLMAPAPQKPGPPSQVLTPGSKVSLQADTGSFFSRCKNSQQSVNNGAPDSITTHITNANPVPFAVFEVVDAGNGKIAFKADTGKFVARCQGCIIGGSVPNFVTVHVAGPTPPEFARFTPELLPNGKVALKADTGKYVNRCRNCSSGAAVSDTVTINATDPRSDVTAQWTVVSRSPTPAPAPAPAPSKGEILVSRFFAPKIVNFSVAPEQREVGWRRLVRINARPGSQAQKHFVESAWVLFNHFTKPPIHSPFGGSNVPTQEVKGSPWGNVTVTTPASNKNGSVNTQVALITHCPQASSPCQEEKLNSIYWMDFGASDKGYKLSYQLDAFFDAGSLPGSAPYFVPNGCDTCHGSLRGNAVLNHLDTDHWMDRLADGDFPALARPDAPAPLFDAGKNTKTPQYAAAFDVLRRLNQEVATMQQRTNPNAFHLAATRKWLDMHKSSVEPELDLVKRSVDFFNTGHPLKKDRKPASTPLNWTAGAGDRELIGLMNKYCYRCHGAVRFDVFSKDMVADQASPILDRVDPNPTQQKIIGFKMPVDRDMDPKDKQRLLELIEKLYDETH